MKIENYAGITIDIGTLFVRSWF